MTEKKIKLFGYLKKRDWIIRWVGLVVLFVINFSDGYTEGWNGQLGIMAGVWTAVCWTIMIFLFWFLLDLIVFSIQQSDRKKERKDV